MRIILLIALFIRISTIFMYLVACWASFVSLTALIGVLLVDQNNLAMKNLLYFFVEQQPHARDPLFLVNQVSAHVHS